MDEEPPTPTKAELLDAVHEGEETVHRLESPPTSAPPNRSFPTENDSKDPKNHWKSTTLTSFVQTGLLDLTPEEIELQELTDVDPYLSDEPPMNRIFRLVIFSKWFAGATLILVIFSLVLFIIGLTRNTPHWVVGMDIVVTTFYALEVGCRWLIFQTFWSQWFNRIDVILLVACIIEAVLTFTVELNAASEMGIIIFRFLIRLLRSIQLIRHQHQYVGMGKTIAEDHLDVENFDYVAFNQQQQHERDNEHEHHKKQLQIQAETVQVVGHDDFYVPREADDGGI